MILQQATIKYKGYDPLTLSKGSGRRICCSCDECGRVRYVRLQDYRDLCVSCNYKRKEWKYNCGNGSRGRIQTKFEKEKRQISNKLSMTNNLKNKLSELNSGKNNYWFEKKLTLDHRISLSCAHLGINKSEWDGFSKDHPYPIEFNRLKQSIRDRYNNCDYISGIHKNVCNKGINLDVHHIDYNKENSNTNNFIPLSKSNHTITGNNRSFWYRLFTYSLQYEKEYMELI